MEKTGQNNKFLFELITRFNDSKDKIGLTSQADAHSNQGIEPMVYQEMLSTGLLIQMLQE